jgi:hypothetical protein
MINKEEIKIHLKEVGVLGAIIDDLIKHKNISIKTDVSYEELLNWKKEIEKYDLCVVFIEKLEKDDLFTYKVIFSDNRDYWS